MKQQQTSHGFDNYVRNSAFANGQEAEMRRIIEDHIGKILSYELCDRNGTAADKKHCTDILVKTSGGELCLRIRRPTPYRDLTIRNSVPSGRKTERDKLRNGHGDYYFYFWTDDSGRIVNWWIVNMAEVRRAGLLDYDWEVKHNKDGSTFIAIPYDVLAENECIVMSKVDDMISRSKASQCEWGEHKWVQREGRGGQMKLECEKCGKFYGYLRHEK